MYRPAVLPLCAAKFEKANCSRAMEHSCTVKYDRALVRRALHCFMFHRLGCSGIGALLLLPVLFLASYFLALWNVYLSIIAVVYVIVAGVIIFIYFLRLRTSEGFFEKSKDPCVCFTFSNEGVETNSDIGSSFLKWAAFDELMEFSDVWLLVYARSGYITLPVKQLTSESQLFIEEKLANRTFVQQQD